MLSSRTLRARLASGAAIVLLAVGAVSCDGSTSPARGQISLRLTDAPGDVVTAVVTIDRIYLQPGEAGTDGRVVIREDDLTTDLLTLVGTSQEIVDEADIPVGDYSQLRFVISGAYIEVEQADGSTRIYASSPTYAGLPVGATVFGTLQMPSLATSGLKVNLPNDAIEILEDESIILLVDFDVSQSFGQAAGGSGMWVMSPVIHATHVPTL